MLNILDVKIDNVVSLYVTAIHNGENMQNPAVARIYGKLIGLLEAKRLFTGSDEPMVVTAGKLIAIAQEVRGYAA